MGVLDDTAIFVAIVQQGGFSHAAKHLGLSNGLISRRIADLETQLGVTLLKRTTRQLQLTSEGELFWQHAQRIQQEMDSALSLIQTLTDKPKGIIRVTASVFFGRYYLLPIITKFMNTFNDIKVELILTNEYLDPIKEKLDLIIRGSGYFEKEILKDSTMKMKTLVSQKIGLYASPDYLAKFGEPKHPDELTKHSIIGYADTVYVGDTETWFYRHQNKRASVTMQTKFNCNDVESSATVCASGYGIGKFADIMVGCVVKKQGLKPILKDYDWGEFQLNAIYAQQQALPKRTRLLLDFISAHTDSLKKPICS